MRKGKFEIYLVPSTHTLRKGFEFMPKMVTNNFLNKNFMQPMRGLNHATIGDFPFGESERMAF
jgi:hypothetical protein